jgi:hypothetical protein
MRNQIQREIVVETVNFSEIKRNDSHKYKKRYLISEY